MQRGEGQIWKCQRNPRIEIGEGVEIGKYSGGLVKMKMEIDIGSRDDAVY